MELRHWGRVISRYTEPEMLHKYVTRLESPIKRHVTGRLEIFILKHRSIHIYTKDNNVMFCKMRRVYILAPARRSASSVSNRRMWVSAPRENNALVPSSSSTH